MGLRVTVAHLRALKLCKSGTVEWCARHGFDFGQLCTQGLDAEAVAATGDHFGMMAADKAREEAQHHGDG